MSVAINQISEKSLWGASTSKSESIRLTPNSYPRMNYWSVLASSGSSSIKLLYK